MTAPTIIRFLTVDRQPLIHGGVQHLLRPFDDLQPVGEAYDLSDALWQMARHAPDLVLVEIADLGLDWASGLACIGQASRATRLVVFSNTAEAADVRGALQAGASGYLLKDAQALTLAQALRGIAAGHQILAPEAAESLLKAYHAEDFSLAAFSQREREVLAWLARGLSNDAIAARLHVSKATVKFHCGNIFAKLGVKTRVQALVKAHEHGLAPRLVARGAGQPLEHERQAPAALARGA